MCTFTCFSLFCGFLAPFLTSFSCFSISDDLKHHFRIFMDWKFYGNLLHFCVAFPVRFCRSPIGLARPFFPHAWFSWCAQPAPPITPNSPGPISKIHCESSCHSPNTWVSAKISQGSSNELPLNSRFLTILTNISSHTHQLLSLTTETSSPTGIWHYLPCIQIPLIIPAYRKCLSLHHVSHQS